jgi:antitoxin component YwqK of YwqJK toxin-antitoxin module
MKKIIMTVLMLASVMIINAEIIQKGTLENPRFFKDNTQIFGEDIDGQVKAYWDSVKVRCEYNYKKGIYDGLQKEFYSSGKLSAEWNMKEGKRTGSGKEYYEDGTLSFSRDLNDNGDGFGTEFYKNGMKKRERAYQNGVQVHASKLNHNIKGERFKRTAEELFLEAQEYGALSMYGHAIETYTEFLEKYPKHERAADAKFLIAFTYHNSLKEEDLAKKNYQEFLKMFPQSPLCVSAEFELENIGKEIDNLELFKGNDK